MAKAQKSFSNDFSSKSFFQLPFSVVVSHFFSQALTIKENTCLFTKNMSIMGTQQMKKSRKKLRKSTKKWTLSFNILRFGVLVLKYSSYDAVFLYCGFFQAQKRRSACILKLQFLLANVATIAQRDLKESHYFQLYALFRICQQSRLLRSKDV